MDSSSEAAAADRTSLRQFRKPPADCDDRACGARRLGEGLRNPLALAGGIERGVDDAADAALEPVDKSALLRVAVRGWPRPSARREGGTINEAFQKKLHVTVFALNRIRNWFGL
jgi:hypothetical protein